MKKWNITGADRTTGEDVFRCVEAESSDDAVKMLLSEMVIEKVEESKGYKPARPARPPPPPRPKVPYSEANNLRGALLVITALSLLLAIVGLLDTVHYSFFATGAGVEARSTGGESGRVMLASGLSSAFIFWTASVVVDLLRSIAINTTPTQATRP